MEMDGTFLLHNESDTLEVVIIGGSDGYGAFPQYIEKVNDLQQNNAPPSLTSLREELQTFKTALEALGAKVLIPRNIGKIVYDQLTPRDIGFVVGSKFVLSNMAKQSRRYECVGIFDIIFRFNGEEPNILIPPSNCLVEGGDIIVDKQKIFVGLSERTNIKGVEFLQKSFGHEFEVIPLTLQEPGKNGFFLHLDCVFNPVGKDHALIYSAGLKKIPELITSQYKLIEINEAEQAELGTNVLSFSRDVILSRKHNGSARINELLRKEHKVIEIKFDGVPSTGGSLRCASLPLTRRKNS